MTIFEIFKFPNNILNNKSETIKEINNNIKSTVSNMKDTMYINNGIGLAAIQVGIKQQLLIINTLDKEKEILVIINPIIVYYKKKTIYKEGCLSFPNIFIDVERKKIIKIIFLSLDGKKKIIKVDNLLSICLQHEIDHLNGITLYEKASKIKKNMILKKIK
ncbi:MAG TPA: peptide deformylase [Candidatus Azoamicus sp.]